MTLIVKIQDYFVTVSICYTRSFYCLNYGSVKLLIISISNGPEYWTGLQKNIDFISVLLNKSNQYIHGITFSANVWYGSACGLGSHCSVGGHLEGQLQCTLLTLCVYPIGPPVLIMQMSLSTGCCLVSWFNNAPRHDWNVWSRTVIDRLRDRNQ